eukprot:304102-Chlamydomonas_euryale.AAC.2
MENTGYSCNLVAINPLRGPETPLRGPETPLRGPETLSGGQKLLWLTEIVAPPLTSPWCPEPPLSCPEMPSGAFQNSLWWREPPQTATAIRPHATAAKTNTGHRPSPPPPPQPPYPSRSP